jgi:serine/threonine protein kinase
MSNLAGKNLLNRYQVKEFISSGGMSDVYYVWDTTMHVHLAMKVLHMDLVDDPLLLRFFEREARALEKLKHPNIVPFYGLQKTSQFMFLLEEFIDGPSLKQVLEKRRSEGQNALSIEHALIYTKAVYSALGYAHASGVVHCDVKPGNVMIDEGGNIFLADFGIARHAYSTETTVGIAGSPLYMAPEQIKGEAVTPATDIYSLGIMVFELLTGKRPFTGSLSGTEKSGDTVANQIRKAHLILPPPNPCDINPQIPDSIANVILKALEKKPENRYSNTTEFFFALCDAAGTTPDQVPDRVPSSILPSVDSIIDESLTAREKKLSFKWSYLILALFIGLLLLVGGNFLKRNSQNGENLIITNEVSQVNQDNPLSGVVPILTNTTEPSSTPETEFTEETTITLTFTPTSIPTETPTSEPIVEAIGGADKISFINQNEVWVANLDGSELTQLTKDGAEKKDLGWTPDGEALKYISGKCIYQVQLDSKEIQTIACFNFAIYLKTFDISPNSEKVAISLDNQLYIVPFDRQALSQVKARSALSSMAECPEQAPLEKYVTLFARWSTQTDRLALITWGIASGLGAVDMVRVIPSNSCNDDPEVIVNFPAPFFVPEEFSISSELETIGWDGYDMFAFTGNIRNNGYGNLYIFNIDKLKAVDKLNPIDDGGCCYRDPQWSPDGSHLLFVYQKYPGGDNKSVFYYIPYSSIGTGVSYSPLPLPSIDDPKAKPLPVLRPAK